MPTPPLAAVAGRVDFLLPIEKIGIEVKLARTSRDQGRIVGEINSKRDHYHAHPDCRTLVVFVYDPSHALRNPTAMERDLSKVDSEPQIIVVVAPNDRPHPHGPSRNTLSPAPNRQITNRTPSPRG